MLREILKSKIHRVTVTDVSVDYVGSIAVDELLMQKANLVPNERVDVLNIHNGQRFSTYIIKASYGSGSVCVNGAAARLACIGDRLIIVSYGLFGESELADFSPYIVHVDSNNHPLADDKKTGK